MSTNLSQLNGWLFSRRLIMDVRNRLIALWWADYIYRKFNNEQACDNDWWSQVFILGGE